MIQYYSVKNAPKCLLLTAFFYLSFYVNAQPGALDPSFGQNGKVLTFINGSYPDMRASAMQSDGKIIFVGNNSSIEGDGVLVLRYLANGMLDSTFGDNGKVYTDFGPDFENATCLAIAPDNSIIVGGSIARGTITLNYDILLVKYKANGNTDSSFGINGKVTKGFGFDEQIYSISLQEDGRIVLGGSAGADFFITRFNSNAEVDASFGVNGFTTTDFFSLDNGFSTAIQKDGKILLGGSSGDKSKFILARYLTNGQLDPTFGNAGKTITDIPDGNEGIYSIALQSDSKIIAGGISGITLDALNENMTLVRYNIDGKKDLTFGKDGEAVISFEGVNTDIRKVIIRPDDKITVLGRTFKKDVLGALDFALAAFTENGVIDSSFGIAGQVVTDFGNEENNVSGFLQPDGKIVLTGMSNNFFNAEYKLALARYLNSSQEQYVRIKNWLHHHGITWEDKPKNLINYYSVQSSSNGNAFTEVARIFSNHDGGIQTYTAANNATANYRVASVSNTGNITYSNTLTLVNTTPTIQLYPNPAKNNLQIQGLPAGTTKLRVTDLSGNTRIIATTNSTVYSINIAQLTSGNYLLNIKTENEVITKQFIKE